MFLGVFFVVTGAYAVITYNHTHQNLLTDASHTASQYYTTLLQAPESIAYEINSPRDSFTEVSVYIHIANGVSGYDETLFAETGKGCAVRFSADNVGSDSAIGVIDYSEFRSSMSDEQYKKISAYLKSKPDKTDLSGDVRYALLCRSFYYNNKVSKEYYNKEDNKIYPKIVEIVVTNDTNGKYEEDELVESFELELDLDKTTGPDFCESGAEYRNEIDTDFVLENYENRNLLDYVENSKAESGDDISELKTGLFSYIYWTQKSSTGIDKDRDSEYFINFAREYNVLGECSVNILIASIIIFIFFLFVGVIVSHLSWKAICTEIEQENIRRDMTRAMAHDLKTPLFIISGYAENLRENINTDKREYYADVIIEQTKRMDELVHSMLDFSRFDSDNFVLNRESFSLVQLVRNTVEKYPDNRLVFSCDSDCEISADRNLLTTVIDNFIENAVKYGAPDKPIEIFVKGASLSITNGIEKEITQDELVKIWEPYAKLNTARDSKGNGLGLAISKRILEMHGFDYGVESENDKIIFWIVLS